MNSEQRDFGAKLFSALSNKSRIHLVEVLSKGQASVTELAEAVGLKQSITSQHLAVLQNAGIVICHPEGQLHFYSLRGPRIIRILELVGEFYELHLDNLRHLLEDTS